MVVVVVADFGWRVIGMQAGSGGRAVTASP